MHNIFFLILLIQFKNMRLCWINLKFLRQPGIFIAKIETTNPAWIFVHGAFWDCCFFTEYTCDLASEFGQNKCCCLPFETGFRGHGHDALKCCLGRQINTFGKMLQKDKNADNQQCTNSQTALPSLDKESNKAYMLEYRLRWLVCHIARCMYCDSEVVLFNTSCF